MRLTLLIHSPRTLKKKKIVQEYESCVTVNISFTGDVFQWFLVHKNLLWLLKNATGQYLFKISDLATRKLPKQF